eukprot:1159971-Pelagomonas_calceolata.AAC.9
MLKGKGRHPLRCSMTKEKTMPAKESARQTAAGANNFQSHQTHKKASRRPPPTATYAPHLNSQ